MDVDLDQTTSLCRNVETEGFDLLAGQTWIYPTNYPVREYQFNIVSLPTGLGKTFIAAVLMFNFYRWYPIGKIVFMAPTRPLVKQQMDACYDIMGIPKESTVELIAHKARGNHAYCEVIKKMCKLNKYFRVLALSATPGSHVEDVLEVVQNLMISHLEFRTEESLDVCKYVFKRNLTTVVVPLDEKLQEVVNEYLKILEINTRTLMKYKVFQGSCGSLTKGKIFMTMKQYQQNRGSGTANYGEIMKCFTVCMTLYHAWELLVRHGLRSFTSFFDEHIDKPTLRHNMRLIQLIQDIKEYLGPPPIVEDLPDGECIEMSKDVKFGHPKFYKLRDILLTHFEGSSSSKVIVFFEYRESVMEAYALLRQSGPTIRPKVVKAFREGQCNTLLSTSIGEEGLDVGEVDLIICFDISNKSPIRMVQRMGRTGRKKEGSIIVLVTEGKEQQTLKDCLIHKNNVASHVLGSRELARGLSSTSPRLIPAELTPKCEKIFITVTKEPVAKKNITLKEMFRKVSSGGSEPIYSPNLQITEIEERIPSSKLLLDNDETEVPQDSIVCKQIQKQRSFQDTYIVKHSKETELLVNLLQLADSKKFNIPMSQIGCIVRSVHELKKPLSPLHEEKSSFGSRELFNELLNFLTIQSLEYDQQCKLCPSRNCIELYTNLDKTDSVDALNWVELDDSVFTSITLNDLKTYEKNLDEPGDECVFEETMNFVLDQTPQLKTEDEILEANDIDKSILGELVNESFGFQAPKTLDLLLNKFSSTIAAVQPSQETKEETRESVLIFFKIKKLSELFTDCLHSTSSNSQDTILYSPNIFDSSVQSLNEITPNEQTVSTDDSGSPILCTFRRDVALRNKDQSQKKLVFEESKEKHNRMASCSTPFQENPNREINPTDDMELSSLCDLSYLGFKTSSKKIDSQKKTVVTSTQVGSALKVDETKHTLDRFTDVLDDSDFKWLTSPGLAHPKTNIDSKTIDPDISNVNLVNYELNDTSHKKAAKEEQSEFGKNAVDEEFDWLRPTADLMENSATKQSGTDTDFEPAKGQQVVLKQNLEFGKKQGFENNAKDKANLSTEPITISDDDDDIIDWLMPTAELVKKTATETVHQNKLNKTLTPSTNKKSTAFPSKLEETRSKKVKTAPKVEEHNDFQWVKPKTIEKTNVSDKKITNDTTLDILDVSDIFDTSDFNLTKEIPSTNTSKADTSQATVTQLISLINKPDGGPNNSSQKENQTNHISHRDSAPNANITHILSLVNTNTPNRERFSVVSGQKSIFLEDTSSRNSEYLHNTFDVDDLDDFEVRPARTPYKPNRCNRRNNRQAKLSREMENNPSAHDDRISPKMNDSDRRTSSDIHLSDSEQLEPNLDESIRNLSHNMLAQLVDSDDEFENKPRDTGWIRAKPSDGKRRDMKRKNEFIDDEAELSEDSNVEVSDDERDGLSQNCYEESFVAHESVCNDTQMHARYLQSDSFVVEGDEVEEIEELSQLEILERQLEIQRKARKKLKNNSGSTNRRRRILNLSDSD
nr:unnamed protein product [Callosobruchus analis]